MTDTKHKSVNRRASSSTGAYVLRFVAVLFALLLLICVPLLLVYISLVRVTGDDPMEPLWGIAGVVVLILAAALAAILLFVIGAMLMTRRN